MMTSRRVFITLLLCCWVCQGRRIDNLSAGPAVQSLSDVRRHTRAHPSSPNHPDLKPVPYLAYPPPPGPIPPPGPPPLPGPPPPVTAYPHAPPPHHPTPAPPPVPALYGAARFASLPSEAEPYFAGEVAKSSFAEQQQDNLVVHGNDVETPGKWPWQCSIQNDYLGNFCGGSYLGGAWVLTAAHCLEKKEASQVRIVFGAHYINTRSGGRPETIQAKRFITHKLYRQGGYFENDIALIEVAAPPKLSQYVKEAKLPPNNVEWIGKKCYITGWGLTASTQSPIILQEAKLDVIPWRDCKIRTMYIYGGPMKNTICAFDNTDKSRVKGAGKGDSGGPLQCEYNKEWFVVGVTSWGLKGKPTAFMEVSAYKDWINQNTRIDDNNDNNDNNDQPAGCNDPV